MVGSDRKGVTPIDPELMGADWTRKGLRPAGQAIRTGKAHFLANFLHQLALTRNICESSTWLYVEPCMNVA
jgi:hypothetical protein